MIHYLDNIFYYLNIITLLFEYWEICALKIRYSVWNYLNIDALFNYINITFKYQEIMHN